MTFDPAAPRKPPGRPVRRPDRGHRETAGRLL